MIKALENWGTFSVIAYRKQLYWVKYMVASIKVAPFLIFPEKTAVITEITPVSSEKTPQSKGKKSKRKNPPLGKCRGMNFGRPEQGAGRSVK